MVAGPAQTSLAQTGAGGDDGHVPLGVGLPFIEDYQILFFEHLGAVRGGLQIVEQGDLIDLERGAELVRIDQPRQIDGAHRQLAHRTGNGYDDAAGLAAGLLDECLEECAQVGIIGSGIAGFG